MRSIALLLATSVLAFAADKPLTPEALIDRVIVRPGNFSQMCDAPDPMSPKVPLPIYRLVLERELHPSEEDYAELRARRAEVVPALVKRLAKLDLSKAPPMVGQLKFKESGPDTSPDEEKVDNSGISPRHLSGLLFEMIIALDAVETIPELLRLEEQLRSLLAAADADKKIAPPVVPIDGSLSLPDGDKQLTKRDEKFLKGRITQRELLSVVLQLLRRQRYEPVLDSDLEKTYATAVIARAKEEDLADYQTPADAKAKGDEWLKFDPILKLPLGYMRTPPSVPFGPEVREQIRGWAEAFMKDMPPTEWKINAELP